MSILKEQAIWVTALVILLGLSLAVGMVLALPSVTARFLGSHTWYQSPGCVQCHENIASEAASSTTNAGPHKQTQTDSNCKDCHEYGAGAHYVNRSYGFCGSRSGCHPTYPAIINASGHGSVPTKPEPIACIMCHTGVNLTLSFKGTKELIIISNMTKQGKGTASYEWRYTNRTEVNVGKTR
ncbi:MAG: hypothetical protein HY929_03015 [Euryarchaeota archaeon]|nr:hypothetical protein [Euryarchaeota archaeon]